MAASAEIAFRELFHSLFVLLAKDCMMLAILLFGFLEIGTLLAIGAMIYTWRQYAPAWAALDAEKSDNDPALVRYLTIRVVSDRNRSLLPEFRTPFADRQCRAMRVAA